MSIRDDGYKKFAAAERNVNDQAQDCTATLTVKDGDNDVDYVGSTGKGQGHAEMHALHLFLQDFYDTVVYNEIDKLVEKNKIDMKTARNDEYVAEYAAKQFDKFPKTITCADKSCCVNCSAILGHLNIPAGANTYKTKERMGLSTEYALGMKVKAFVAAYLKKLGYGKESINQFFDYEMNH